MHLEEKIFLTRKQPCWRQTRNILLDRTYKYMGIADYCKKDNELSAVVSTNTSPFIE